MKGTRFRAVLRESLGNIYREVKIALTPIPFPDKWLFLVGCYNSGTTLLAELLSRHQQISGLPTEGHFISDQFIKDYEVGLPRMWAGREELFRLTEDDQGPDVERVKKEWGMRLDLSKPVLMEKSPPNTVRTRWLNKHFTPAYFVVIVRNGYAVAEGINRKANPMHLKESWPIEQCALQWRRSIEVLDADSQHLDNYLMVTYEELVKNPDIILQKITDFVGLDRMGALDTATDFSIHEMKEGIRNMNDESIERLTTGQIVKINKVIEPFLRRYGYEILET